MCACVRARQACVRARQGGGGSSHLRQARGEGGLVHRGSGSGLVWVWAIYLEGVGGMGVMCARLARLQLPNNFRGCAMCWAMCWATTTRRQGGGVAKCRKVWEDRTTKQTKGRNAKHNRTASLRGLLYMWQTCDHRRRPANPHRGQVGQRREGLHARHLRRMQEGTRPHHRPAR